jgi:hypothetical protein
MAAFTMDQIAKSGGGEFAFVLHVGGMDWAATNDSRLITALNLTDTAPTSPTTAQQNAIDMRQELFGYGYYNTAVSHFCPANEVKILKNLNDNLGSQTIDFDEENSIRAGSWRTSCFGGLHGYTWQWSSDVVCRGVMGLDVAPALHTPGVVSGIMSRDFDATKTSTLGWQDALYWWADTDEGLKAAIDAALTAGDWYPLWVGNSCLWVVDTSVSTSGDEYFVNCYNQVWNTPNEQIFKDNENGLETLRITNVPQKIKDADVNLVAIHWDADMQAQYEEML